MTLSNSILIALAGVCHALPAIEDSPARTIFNGPVPLRIDWLHPGVAPENFIRTDDPARGIVKSSHRLGATTISRTIFASKEDNAIFLHCIADKPGDISFRATLAGETSTIENRRELVFTDGKTKARAWIIPFESDVEAEGNTVILRGEGECLIVFAFTRGEDPARPLAETWKRLSARHAPDQDPPDPTKVWQAILAEATL